MCRQSREESFMKIGFILPLGEDTDLGRAPTWEEIRSLAEQSEAAGLDSVWVYDHLLYRFPSHPATVGVHECWSILSALASATSRVELGTLVMPTGWRNPALLAKMATTVDAISGGRLILGLGTGFHEPEFAAFGYPFDHRVDRFEEELQIITALLRDGKVDFHGRYHDIPNGEMAPRSPREGAIPVLVACRGPRMMQLTARYADAWNIAWFGDITASTADREQFAAACAEAGREVAVTVGVHLAPPDEPFETAPEPNRLLTGTPEEVAAALLAYRDAGVAHVIVGALAHTNYDYTRRTIAHLTAALAHYRAGA
jgi:alkanesulfonate monooxygenase SsuD/methylene tetrahydromethanopterin reductase-like flavin-dependent oxidoreductase (luciferase family)